MRRKGSVKIRPVCMEAGGTKYWVARHVLSVRMCGTIYWSALPAPNRPVQNIKASYDLATNLLGWELEALTILTTTTTFERAASFSVGTRRGA